MEALGIQALADFLVNGRILILVLGWSMARAGGFEAVIREAFLLSVGHFRRVVGWRPEARPF